MVQSADYRGRLRDYSLRKGRILFWPQTLYRSDGAVVINLILYWACGHREPWYLATSLADPRQAVRMYRKRMQPEQYFKDGKQCFGLNRSTVTNLPPATAAAGGPTLGLLSADYSGNAGVANFPTPDVFPGEAGHPAPGLRILPRHSRPA